MKEFKLESLKFSFSGAVKGQIIRLIPFYRICVISAVCYPFCILLFAGVEEILLTINV